MGLFHTKTEEEDYISLILKGNAHFMLSSEYQTLATEEHIDYKGLKHTLLRDLAHICVRCSLFRHGKRMINFADGFLCFDCFKDDIDHRMHHLHFLSKEIHREIGSDILLHHVARLLSLTMHHYKGFYV